MRKQDFDNLLEAIRKARVDRRNRLRDKDFR